MTHRSVSRASIVDGLRFKQSGMRQNRARDAAPTPRAAWVARQGQSSAQPGHPPGAAS
jgi:hypothetical protein